ncbi:MAG: hypothetical protein Q9170_001701 [Blastenia crenularia]
MKSNPDSFIPYTEGLPVVDYCAVHIEPYNVEIDNLGLQACFEAILRPALIALQVLYLDRTAGEQVNEFNWHVKPSDPPPAYGAMATIRLLYRPGHYDMLYKPEDIPVPPPAVVTNPQINLMSDPIYIPSGNLCYAPQQGLDMNTIYLPGFASAGISSMPFLANPYPVSAACVPSSLPMSPPPPEPYGLSFSAPPPEPHPITSPPLRSGINSEGGFRPSIYQFSLNERTAGLVQSEPCQTEAMKQ